MKYERNIRIMAQVANVSEMDMLESRRYPLAQLRALMAGDMIDEGFTKREIAFILHKNRTTIFHLVSESEKIRDRRNGYDRVISLYAKYQQKLIAEDMTKQECIDVLQQYNDWRRYDGELGKGPAMIERRVVGIAIDRAIEYIKETL